MTTTIAYTNQRTADNKYSGTDNIRSVQSPELSIAHSPMAGTGFTECGVRIVEVVEVDDSANIRVCLSCQSRLQAKYRQLQLRAAAPPPHWSGGVDMTPVITDGVEEWQRGHPEDKTIKRAIAGMLTELSIQLLTSRLE